MMQIENTFFDLATTCSTNCLVICDRGTMDATACECFTELAANLIHFQVIIFLSERVVVIVSVFLRGSIYSKKLNTLIKRE